jgi:dihydroneopterin aldolase
MRDQIILKGLKFMGCHGVEAIEKIQPQEFEVDLIVDLDLRPSGLSDDLSHSLDYTVVFREVKAAVEENRFNLLEALAEEIARRTLEHHMVTAVQVTVKKPRPPLAGDYRYFAVRIERTK